MHLFLSSRVAVSCIQVSAAHVVISTWYQSVTWMSLIYGFHLQIVQL